MAARAGSPWTRTDYDSAQSRANLTEKTLTRTTARKVRYPRGVASPQDLPRQQLCTPNTIVAPVLTGGSVYAVANGRLTKYDAAAGGMMWRRHPRSGRDAQSLGYQALSVAKGLVVVGAYGCGSVSDPNGYVQAYKASTGASLAARCWPGCSP